MTLTTIGIVTGNTLTDDMDALSGEHLALVACAEQARIPWLARVAVTPYPVVMRGDEPTTLY
jgi:hypothetical protein